MGGDRAYGGGGFHGSYRQLWEGFCQLWVWEAEHFLIIECGVFGACKRYSCLVLGTLMGLDERGEGC